MGIRLAALEDRMTCKVHFNAGPPTTINCMELSFAWDLDLPDPAQPDLARPTCHGPSRHPAARRF